MTRNLVINPLDQPPRGAPAPQKWTPRTGHRPGRTVAMKRNSAAPLGAALLERKGRGGI